MEIFPYFQIHCRIAVRQLFNKLLHLNAGKLSLFARTYCVDKISYTNGLNKLQFL